MVTEFNINEIKNVVEHGASVRVEMQNGSVLVFNTDNSNTRNELNDFFSFYAYKNAPKGKYEK